ncbi:RNA-directed DNA polymerase, eukaryota, partial [Tanacetum coccineum]
MLVWGKLIQKLRQKGVYEESFFRHVAWIGGKLIQFMHTTMVPEQVKTMKIQAGVQVLRLGELRRHLQLWKYYWDLSPLIFILVMESLDIAFSRVVEAGMYKGIGLTPSFNLSHMFYADDAVFMGQWSEKNINTIIYVLKCFQQASGLHINLSKSKLMGLAVGDESVSQAANQIGCGVLKAPFTYLGSIVGANMSQIQSWDAIVGKMEARLSKWK